MNMQINLWRTFLRKTHKHSKTCLVIILPLLLACKPPNTLSLSPYDLERIAYFKEIALGFEFSSAAQITRKWTTDLSIYVSGNPGQELSQELDQIIAELNELTQGSIYLKRVSKKAQSNFHIFFGPAKKYASLYPESASQAEDNWGLFFVYWNGKQELNQGHMYVDISRADPSEQKHLLREELTQALGLAKDSKTYPDSIFQQDWSTTTQYSLLDKDLIRLLYHPDMAIGLDKQAVDCYLSHLLLAEP